MKHTFFETKIVSFIFEKQSKIINEIILLIFFTENYCDYNHIIVRSPLIYKIDIISKKYNNKMF